MSQASVIANDPKWTTEVELHADFGGVGIDLESGVIRGVVVAEVGIFKTRRGQFTQASLDAIVQLAAAKPDGLKVRLNHNGTGKRGVGFHLGRLRNLRLEGQRVRGDLYIDPVARKRNIHGGDPPGTYVLEQAESDPGSLNMSLVLLASLRDVDGQPPVFLPVELKGCDVVEDGDAVHGALLSTDIADEHVQQLKQIVAETLASHLPGESGMSNSSNTAAPNTTDNQPKAPELTDAQLASIVDSVSARIEEKLAGVNQLVSSFESQQTAAREKERATKIAALCADANCADEAAKYIEDAELSVEDVRSRLWKKVVESRQLPTGQQDPSTTAAGERKVEEELSAEFEEGREILEGYFNLSAEDYIKARKVDKGLLQSTNPLVTGKYPKSTTGQKTTHTAD